MSPGQPSDAAQTDISRLAVEDLAARTGLAVEQITVVRNEEVTWPDGSLGCAKAGMNYVTMLVPGHLIVLDASGTTYEYHAAQREAAFLCNDPQPPLPPGASGT